MSQQEIKAVREDLRAKGGYLADPQVLGRLEWFEETKQCHRLVAREAAAQYRQALDANGPQQPPPSAVLSAIVRLNDYGFYMTASGGWDPYGLPANAPQKLADVKPSAWAADPCIPAISGDFKIAWANLAKLIKGYFPKNSRRFQKSGGAINWSGGKGDCSHGFQVRHRLFEPKPKPKKNAAKKEENEDEAEEVDPRFSIDNWPVGGPAVQSHLLALKSTHIVNPIPAYDAEGNLIPPTEYKDQLRGAIVRLEVRLTHWIVRKEDFFIANVERIRVLAPPLSHTSPRKRLAPVDDFYDTHPAIPPTPNKRVRVKKEEERQYGLF